MNSAGEFSTYDFFQQPIVVVLRENGSIKFENKAFRDMLPTLHINRKSLADILIFLESDITLQKLLSGEEIEKNFNFAKVSNNEQGNIAFRYFQVWISSMNDDKAVVLMTPYDHVLPEYIEDPFLRSHNRVADFIDNAPILAHATDKDFNYIYANKKELSTLGYTMDEIRGKRIASVALKRQPPTTIQKIEENKRSIREKKTVVENFVTFVSQNGTSVDLASCVNGKFSENSEKLEYYRSFLRDHKERQLMESIESLLKHETKVVRKMNNTRDRMIRDILHELKTPAQIFLSMNNDLASFDSSDIELVKETLGGTMKDILLMADDFHTLDMRHTSQTSIEDFVSHVSSLAKQCIPAGQTILISQEVHADCKSLQIANHLHIQRALFHMLRKAIMHSSEMNIVRVEVTKNNQSIDFVVINKSNASALQTESIIHSSNTTSSAVSLCASPTNVNRKESKIHIDLDYNTTEPEGFGLNITVRVAQLIGGEVVCNVSDGDLVRVVFCVPLEKLSMTNRPQSSRFVRLASPIFSSKSLKVVNEIDNPVIKQRRHSLRILIVEDTVTIQKVMARNLDKLGHVCQCADNGEDALAKIENRANDPAHLFDVILMDLRMPVMDGITATSLIRNHSNVRVREIPIAIITADCTSSVKDAASRAGADTFFEKPVTIETLANFLEGLVIED